MPHIEAFYGGQPGGGKSDAFADGSAAICGCVRLCGHFVQAHVQGFGATWRTDGQGAQLVTKAQTPSGMIRISAGPS